ncbi:phosphate/phosphite/phosphonate ABC transporter substrate-binding protein [Hoeflea poritis]|uniref:PhnD/SsuA/transferrin family substrate-binding protein n=1 Tax=Hoeflea poritis TaxID=2993659 RepID=A0ABT4VGF7_9HYPH|nr:PhnD/SsuA/transferrin family substrate-binding protein [Hoeflea poritis]MDA4843785.1 PhnD/SsuA/transferrin family substrate-binding protein [Hoeflea poritis]
MSATAFVAALPMYDWPEVQTDNDRFWNKLRESLRAHGFPAPDRMQRDVPESDLWQHPDLVLGQTCGLPLVRDLMQKVRVVGTPAYDIACGAGSYYSVMVVHRDSAIEKISDLKGKRFAYNSLCSQSGYAAPAYHLREIAGATPIFSSKVQSGSHRGSIRMVAGNEADVASIDAVAWRLAERHEEAAKELRVLATTEPMPGLPVICARRAEWSNDRMHLAVVEAMAALEPEVAEALLLTGFAPLCDSDYAIIQRHAEIADKVSL